MNVKRILGISLCSLLACSCSSPRVSPWNDHKNNDHAMNYQSKKFANYDVSFDTQKFEDACNGLVSCATNVDIRGYQRNYQTIYDSIYRLYSVKDITEARYYGDSSDKESKALYDKYNELTRTYSKSFSTSAELIYKSGDEAFIKYFFGNKTKEEIEEYLYGQKYDEKVATLNKTISDLKDDIQLQVNNYQKGQMTSDEFMEIYINDYYDLIVAGNDLATYKGYPNYLDYLYKTSFGRDYSYEKSLTFAYQARTNLVPLYKSREKQTLDHPEFDKYLNNHNLCNNYFDFTTYFDSYAKDMGSKYENNYYAMWENGIFYFSSNENSLGTAYVCNLPDENEYLMYFSKDYQGILGVCHEFGHYNAFLTNNKNGGYSMDILETHSTANEILYLEYLDEKVLEDNEFDKDISSSIYNYVTDQLFSVVANALICDIEYFAYTAENLTKDSLQQGIETIRGYYPKINNAYVAYSTVSAAGYYISYGTSGMAVLDIYGKARNNFKNGAECYLNLINYKGSDTTTEGIWSAVGISSPFEEQTYKDLVAKIS